MSRVQEILCVECGLACSGVFEEDGTPRENRCYDCAGGQPCKGGCGQKVAWSIGRPGTGWCRLCAAALAEAEGLIARVADVLRRAGTEDAERLVGGIEALARVGRNGAGPGWRRAHESWLLRAERTRLLTTEPKPCCLGGCGVRVYRHEGRLAFCAACWFLHQTLRKEGCADVAGLRDRVRPKRKQRAMPMNYEGRV